MDLASFYYQSLMSPDQVREALKTPPPRKTDPRESANSELGHALPWKDVIRRLETGKRPEPTDANARQWRAIIREIEGEGRQ
jgi:hypothetical protein